MAQQVPRERFRIGRHVESFVGGDAGKRARRDVAHGIAAGLARRQARLGKPSHRRLDVVQLHEMELHGLPRRDVTEPARVPLGHLGERLELIRREDALWNLHPHHLRIVGLPLTVRAAHEAELAPLVRCQIAALEPLERGDELVDLRIACERQA